MVWVRARSTGPSGTGHDALLAGSHFERTQAFSVSHAADDMIDAWRVHLSGLSKIALGLLLRLNCREIAGRCTPTTSAVPSL